MSNILNNDWKNLLEDEFGKDYYLSLRNFLVTEYKTKTIYPDKYDIFNALHFTSYKDVKVVILGQDPYHGPNQAHGFGGGADAGSGRGRVRRGAARDGGRCGVGPVRAEPGRGRHLGHRRRGVR